MTAWLKAQVKRVYIFCTLIVVNCDHSCVSIVLRCLSVFVFLQCRQTLNGPQMHGEAMGTKPVDSGLVIKSCDFC